MKKRKIYRLAAVIGAAVISAAVCFACVGCESESEKERERLAALSAVQELAYDHVLSAEELTGLTEYPNLTVLDMTAAPMTAQDYEALRQTLPDCDILWQVPFGDACIPNTAKKICLSDVPTEQWKNVRYLPSLESIDLTGSDDWEAIAALTAQLPQCDFSWTVDIMGKTYDNRTAAIDLSGQQVDAEAVAKALPRLPCLAEMNITDCSLTNEEIILLQDTAPDCTFLWTYTLYGKVYESTQTELDLRKSKTRDLTELIEILPCLKNVTRINLLDLIIPSSQIEALADQYPEKKFIWRIYFGMWSITTDAVAFTTRNSDPPLYRLESREVRALRYCTDLVALDMGHNALTDISFLENMTQLKVLILADNRITDISPIANLVNLEYVELFINPFSDATPLAGLTKLRDLNLCRTEVGTGAGSVDALAGMTWLERLWISYAGLMEEDKARLTASLPGCVCEFETWGSTGAGWRNDGRYTWMREFFDAV